MMTEVMTTSLKGNVQQLVLMRSKIEPWVESQELLIIKSHVFLIFHFSSFTNPGITDEIHTYDNEISNKKYGNYDTIESRTQYDSFDQNQSNQNDQNGLEHYQPDLPRHLYKRSATDGDPDEMPAILNLVSFLPSYLLSILFK